MKEQIQFTTISLDFAESLANSTYLSSSKKINESKKRPKEQPWYKDVAKHFYTKTVIKVFGLDNAKEFGILRDRMSKMYVSQSLRKNERMPFEYFKDCFTVLQFRRAGKAFKDFKHFIRLDSKGYPKIIPHPLRLLLAEGDRKIFLAVSTMFGVYRVIPWWPAVTLSSITDPFSGETETLDESLLSRGYRNLLSYAGFSERKRWTLSKPVFLNLRRSSPNGEVSLFTSWLDAIAFWEFPELIIPFLKWNYRLKAYSVLFSFVSILILGYPYYLFNVSSRSGLIYQLEKIINKCLNLFWEFPEGYRYRLYLPELLIGRLGLVKDQTGKSRLVGITNYWIQVSLKPVHDLVLSFLKVIPTDGTYNQLKPVLDLPCGEQYSSFDLTAATDRLPVKLQEQVLSLLIGEELASLWKRLLTFPFSWKDYLVEYAVGQPMGAYSSWAVMALTHHVIIASLFKAGERPLYGVLGDDMAITSKKGNAYKEILSKIGVSISLVKSLEFCYFIEFAKKLINKVNNSVDAIIGPKLIMRALEDKYLHYNLVYEAYARDIIDITDIFGYLNKVTLFTSHEKARLRKIKISKVSMREQKKLMESKSYLRRKFHFIEFGRYILFGPFGLIWKNRHYALKSGLMNGSYLSIPETPRHRTVIFEIFSSKLLSDFEKNRNIGKTLIKSLPLWVSKRVDVGIPALYPYALVLFLLSPGFWLPLGIMIRDIRSENPSFKLRRDTFNEISDAPLHQRQKIIDGIHDRLFESLEKSSFMSTSFDLTIFEERREALNTYLQYSYEWDPREKDVCVTEQLARTQNGIITSPLGHPKRILRPGPKRSPKRSHTKSVR